MEHAATRRRYDKGERRFKHVGAVGQPEFRRVGENPKHVIGICPGNIPDTERERLLNAALAVPNGERELAAPRRLYAVYQGAIYEAQTSDGGRSYHAYPFRGKLSARIIAELSGRGGT